MAQERIENGSVTSLNGTITDVVTTVTVSDASVLSLVPQFRIIVDSEIMLVTGVAGNALTVVRAAEGSTSAPHNDGAVVAQIITRDGIRQLNRDWNNPTFDDANGYPQQILDSAGDTLLRSDFTWINQGSAVDTDLNSGPFLFTVDSTAANSGRLFVRSATAPWKVTAAFIPVWFGSNKAPSVGMTVRDSTIGNFKNICLEAQLIRQDRWNDPTTFGSSVQSSSDFYGGSPIWFQIEDDNVDHFFRVSMDGVNFLTIVQETRTTHTATPDQVGIFLNNRNTSFDMIITATSWNEE